MKRSVLSACAAIVQKEIEFYAGFTCLEYDVNDENTMRVAGTGIFRSIIYANENQPYSAIEQAKTDRKPVFVPQMQHQPHLYGKGRGGGALVYQAGLSGNSVRAVL